MNDTFAWTAAFYTGTSSLSHSLKPSHVIRICLPSQSASKNPQTFAHLVNFSKNLSATFDNHTILLFWLSNEQTFHMFLRDLHFVLCSPESPCTTCAKDHGLFIRITHKSTRSEKPITRLYFVCGLKYQVKEILGDIKKCIYGRIQGRWLLMVLY